MFARLGFVGRVILIVLSLALAFAAVGVALSWIAKERREIVADRFPIPAQAAAIVELIDATPSTERQRVLKAVSGETFVVRIADHVPPDATSSLRMPGVEWLVTQYFESLPDREVVAFRKTPVGMRPIARFFDRLSGGTRVPVVIAVGLKDGTYAVMEVRGDGSRRVFGIPVGFWIGTFGFLFAAIALWAIVREARPLRELATSVERFAEDGAPQMVRARGAPDIRRLIGASNDMQSRIAALIKGRTMLLGAISHDLKTYITRLRLRIESIDAEEQRERAAGDLDTMTSLIDDALAIARGATVSDRRESVDLGDLVAIEVGERQTDRIDFRRDSANALTVVQGDPVALRRVVANLVDNAQHYARQCRVTVRGGDGIAEILIEDDGPGIPETEREAVFEPFYRLEKSRNRATGGSGLGLAIAKQIVEAHGGKIELDRSSLGGARFRVLLPQR